MGWAKYYEDDNEIIQDRMSGRSEKAYQEYVSWTSETSRAAQLLEEKERLENAVLFNELCKIRDSLMYRINLSLSAASSMSDFTVKSIANSFHIVLDDSYNKVRHRIQDLNCQTNKRYLDKSDFEKMKKSLIKNIFYKIEEVVNNVDVITQDEMESIKQDLIKLIGWFYDNNCGIGKIATNSVDKEMIKQFLEREMCMSIVECPVCGNDTISGLRFCTECAREVS